MKPRSFLILAAVLLLIGLGLRFIDLTDAPFDFSATRQLRAAIITRGIYYLNLPEATDAQRQTAIALREAIVDYEPSIFETLVAATWRITGQQELWFARVYAILFWGVGAAALAAAARRLASPGAALVALAYMLFLPFAVIGSRSFQPEPLMVMFLCLAIWAALGWSEEKTWKYALLAGLFGALAAMAKLFAAYMVAGMMLAVVWQALGLRTAFRNRQVWAMAALMLLPNLAIYFLGRAGFAGGYFQAWFLSLAGMLFTPEFYVRWALWLGELVGLAFVFMGLFGMTLARQPGRALLLGLWVGYGLYGMFVPHQTITHDYYHLQLVPLIALSLAPLAEPLLAKLAAQPRPWQTLAAVVALAAVALPGWLARSQLLAVDYRNDPEYWISVGARIPEGTKVVALTQQYGYPISFYGWKRVNLWPLTGELALAEARGVDERPFDIQWAQYTEGMDLFLVTTTNQLERQPELRDHLYNNYAIYDEVEGAFILFDLRQPLNP
ncbi:MAG: hypothetical protein EPO32_07935 [Anaerolineae bacterium]|nr:MAG: hypothetical protein EPO32_07935 [Anaerolineae bacterium]